jgi:hypothetical protein
MLIGTNVWGILETRNKKHNAEFVLIRNYNAPALTNPIQKVTIQYLSCSSTIKCGRMKWIRASAVVVFFVVHHKIRVKCCSVTQSK